MQRSWHNPAAQLQQLLLLAAPMKHGRAVKILTIFLLKLMGRTPLQCW
jgi:hypothetical protein